MGINDPYDRSGQYADGDRGAPLGNYGGLANQNPDRRDVAVGTMMGEGGPRENAAGYGAVLDSIENRIGAIGGGANYGQKRDSTLEGVAKARKGAEYNAWSPAQKNAYGQATRGSMNSPLPGKETQMYDQAMQVYDDYYDLGMYDGIAQGGTFYQQNAHVAGKKAGSYQRNLQNKYGSVKVGKAGHVMTGPGLYGPGSKTGRAGPGYEPVPAAITGSFGGNFAPGAFSDPLLDTPDVQSFVGNIGVNSFGAKNRDAIPPTPPQRPGPIGMRNPINAPMPPMRDPVMGALTGNVGVNSLKGGTAADPMTAAPQPAPRESYWTPGPVARVAGSNATGRETSRTPDGVVHDNAGAYGGGQAFGPNDPFGGLGYSNRGYADVVDSFDQAMGINRTVTDRRGNVIGQGYMAGRGGGGGMEATGHDDSGNATVGDGSYAESSGRNDNNPQGIL